MKTSLTATLTSFALAAGMSAVALANDRANQDKMVNAYGEPAGFANPPAVVVALPVPGESVGATTTTPGLAGLYPLPGRVDRRNFESIGAWQERKDAEARGTVNIGALEILDSGPTGPLDENTQAAATAEVTGQVLARINTTDHVMVSLKYRASALDEASKARFTTAANEVAMRRKTLREDLKNVRQASPDQWAGARTTLAASYNAYVQAQHRAEEALGSVAAD